MLDVLIAVLLEFAHASPQVKDLPREEVAVQMEALWAASKATGYAPELLLAVAYTESRFDRRTVSRRVCRKVQGKSVCSRERGPWLTDELPYGGVPSFFCGPMQVGWNQPWEHCVKLMHDVDLNYMTGAQNLKEWERIAAVKSPACRKGRARLRCAVQGYNGGNAGAVYECAKEKEAGELKACGYMRGVFAMEAVFRGKLRKAQERTRRNQT